MMNNLLTSYIIRLCVYGYLAMQIIATFIFSLAGTSLILLDNSSPAPDTALAYHPILIPLGFLFSSLFIIAVIHCIPSTSRGIRLLAMAAASFNAAVSSFPVIDMASTPTWSFNELLLCGLPFMANLFVLGIIVSRKTHHAMFRPRTTPFLTPPSPR